MAQHHLQAAFVLHHAARVALGPAGLQQRQQQALGALLGTLEGQILETIGADVPGLVPARGKGRVAVAPVIGGAASDAGGRAAAAMLLPARRASRNLVSASGVRRLLRRDRGVRSVRSAYPRFLIGGTPMRRLRLPRTSGPPGRDCVDQQGLLREVSVSGMPRVVGRIDGTLDFAFEGAGHNLRSCACRSARPE